MDDTLSLIVFSGTDDKLESAAVLTAGAAAMGRKVHLFLQYWGLEAFKVDSIRKDHGVTAEAGPEGAEFLRGHETDPSQHWSDILMQGKEIGDVEIHACAKSMEMFGLTKEDLDPIVDDVQGVAAFMLEATGPIAFI